MRATQRTALAPTEKATSIRKFFGGNVPRDDNDIAYGNNAGPNRAGIVATVARQRAVTLVDQYLERVVLGRVTKDFVRFDDLVEGELVRDEVLGRQLVLGDEL